MNKKSIVATLVALALILTGTAYAYWTDTLNVTTKATTGELDVTFVDLGLYAQYPNEQVENGWSIIDGIGDTGFVSDTFFTRNTSYNIIAPKDSLDAYGNRADGYSTITFDAKLIDKEKIKVTVGPYTANNVDGSDRIEIEVNDIYPGYAQAFRSDIINVGTIAAKLGNVKVTVGDELNEETKNLLGVAFLVDREYVTSTSEEGNPAFKLAAAFDETDKFTVGDVSFVRLAAFDGGDLAEYITEANLILNAVSNNEGRMDMYLGIAMDPDAEGSYTTGSTAIMSDQDDAASQIKGATISIDLLWDQFNVTNDDSYAAGISNWLSHQN